ncbi:LINE-1 type transposase domain-containing protein 1 [Tupaia chinensis]|uniref:LINE-1 type transposase domain-containing protein 1 n=1 Tax=Tupaia chinensis TaxID=246437 RepID=L9KW86_TUPCH|nr:LINE-1 type transposase domain-containing protein 1 [Tupaia chinensis]ELW67196.1 LINE-1 type transposase domain-containing protein 1 [Tupaia chinensis]
MGKTLMDSKHETGGIASDSLSFLSIKEVKVAKSGEVQNLEVQKKESSAWKEDETPKLVEDASEVEVMEEVFSGLEEEEEEGEETSEEEEKDTSGPEVKDSTSQGNSGVDTKHDVEELTSNAQTVL